MRRFTSSKINKVFLGIFAILINSGHAKADFTFGEPTNLGTSVNSPQYDAGSSISSDGLFLFFYSLRPVGFAMGWEALDLWVSTRETTTEDWGTPTNLGSTVNSSTMDGTPCISYDGLSLFFDSWRDGGSDIWVTTRANISDAWNPPVNLGPMVNSSDLDIGPCISADGLELYFGSDRTGGTGDWDIWVVSRAIVLDAWGPAVNLGSTVNSAAYDGAPAISSDGLMLFITSGRSGGYGDNDIWVAKRATRDGEWDEPVNLGPMINTSAGEAEPSISSDGRWLYFDDYMSIRPGGVGGSDLWKVSIDPVVDLNSDGIVDAADMCIMIDHWKEDYPLCDIGPMPWGDGIVDVQDLIALSEHLYENVNDPTLIAHWALDEIEGMTAHDNVSGNEDFVVGNALWQPNNGKVNGAIELDGVDDCIIGGVGPNPADGPCSVIAWIKGGAPGQVIISQPAVADFLAVDSEGNLMTWLNELGQGSVPLLSQASVTNGQWHRIGLVWDGSRRALFVDGVKVAEDIEDNQGVYGSGLYIGVGKDYMAGTFFSGLIDDVRIYNRAVRP